MFDLDVSYPKAVASSDDGGMEEAIGWCLERMQDGDRLTVWTSLKSNLQNSSTLYRLVHSHRDVDHVTGRGSGYVRGRGPVLMAWADMDDIGKLIRSAGRRITALCVISWNDEWLRPWVEVAKPEILGDGSVWQEAKNADLDPIVAEALRGLTQTINHNNTISAGFEKDAVVSELLALHDARIPMDADAMQAWALAHGWSGKNPQRLAKYVADIQGGKRPRTKRVTNREYIAELRQRAQASEHGIKTSGNDV